MTLTASVEETILQILVEPPAVLVLSAEIGPQDCLRLLQFLEGGSHPTALLVMTSSFSPGLVLEKRFEVVAAYLTNKATPAKLDKALRTVSAGGCYLGKALWNELGFEQTLTPRECDVVEELLLGRSNKEIAEALFLSTETVNNHRRNLREKLGIEGGKLRLKQVLQRYAGFFRVATRHFKATGKRKREG